MDEQRIRSMEPFSGWVIGKVIGQGRYGKVFVIGKEIAPNRRRLCAMKWIPFPGSESELQGIISQLGGAGEQTLQEHFRLLCNDFCNEIVMMDSVKKCDNIVKYEDHQVIKRRDEIGYDVFIRMELLTPLNRRMCNPMTVGDVVQLGIDLCKGLTECEAHKIIHRDIKPDNIFVDENGVYKLGDFGVARQLDESLSGLSRKGTPSYMAPEVYRGVDYDFRVDMYSLGLVMHRLLNKNRLPYLRSAEGTITAREREAALTERLRGEKPVPPPMEGFDALNRVIGKALSYNPAKRYSSAEQFMKALQSLQKKAKHHMTRQLHLPAAASALSLKSPLFDSPAIQQESSVPESRRVDFLQEPVEVQQHVSMVAAPIPAAPAVQHSAKQDFQPTPEPAPRSTRQDFQPISVQDIQNIPPAVPVSTRQDFQQGQLRRQEPAKRPEVPPANRGGNQRNTPARNGGGSAQGKTNGAQSKAGASNRKNKNQQKSKKKKSAGGSNTIILLLLLLVLMILIISIAAIVYTM